MKYSDIFLDIDKKSAEEKSREELLEECLGMGLPVTENDDIEILKLIYEAAQDKVKDSKKKK